jgi:hypothetical protein
MEWREIASGVALMQYPLRAFGIDFRRCVTLLRLLTDASSSIQARHLRPRMSRPFAASVFRPGWSRPR